VISAFLDFVPGLTAFFTRYRDHVPPKKKAKASKTGLRDDWAQRMRATEDVSQVDLWPQWDMEGYEPMEINTDQSRSASCGMSLTNSSRPPTQPSSDVDVEGGITDDAGEEEERRKLSDNVVHTDAMKAYYSGKPNPVSVLVNVGCCVDGDNTSMPLRTLCQQLLFRCSSSRAQVPTPLMPICGGKREKSVLVIFLYTFRPPSQKSSRLISMNFLGYFLPGSNCQIANFSNFGERFSLMKRTSIFGRQ